jgi:type III pantothenate kinase
VILCLDAGNTQLFGGLFDAGELAFTFQRASLAYASTDELGLFLKAVLKANGVPAKNVTRIALCSVVPDAVSTLCQACTKYFAMEPFILQAGVKTGLKIKYRNPLEVGADRIANAIGAVHLYGGRNIIVVDFGTATTYCVISAQREYLGGVLQPGVRISLESLVQRAAKLPGVEITARERVLGRTTVGSMQSGIYFGQIGSVREIVAGITREVFADNPPMVIGTGALADLYGASGLFDEIIPDLVLKGLFVALMKNYKI